MARRRFSDDDDDDDDRPRDRRDDRDDDYDDRPRRRDRRDDDDYDDRPRRPKGKPGLATAAGILWVIWGGLAVIVVLFNIYALSVPTYHAANVALFGPKTADTMRMISIFQLLLVVLGMILFLLSGIRTLMGAPSSLGVHGALTIAYSAFYFLVGIGLAVYQSSLLEEAFGRMGGRRPPAGWLSGASVVGGVCGGLIVTSGPLLAGIFALACNKNYAIWWRETKGRARYRR